MGPWGDICDAPSVFGSTVWEKQHFYAFCLNLTSCRGESADEHDPEQQHEPQNAPTRLASGLAQSRKTLDCLQKGGTKVYFVDQETFATSSRSMIW